MNNLSYFACLLLGMLSLTCQTSSPIRLSMHIDDTQLKVLEGNTDSLQHSYLLSRVQAQFDKRRKEVDKSLQSKESLLERRGKLRDWFKEKVGELPPNTPLNIQTNGTIKMESYTIDKVVFDSRPHHHVTALFYLPKQGKAPFPAVYIPCGHSTNGKAAETYQKAARLFALNGFAVLQADPISQGERYQVLDSLGKPATKGGTLMHELLGQAMLLTGSNSLIHELQDNVRGLDFLEAHPKVDKDRLAIAGNSGGGTQVLYLAGYDPRVKVATPSCYLATTERKFNTIGSQDGCQQLWGEGAMGIDEQDFLLMAAGIPIRLLAAEQDFFHIDGVHTAYAELKKHYRLWGAEEKIDLVTTDAKHGWHRPLREASVQWCKQWLMNDENPVSEPDDIGWFEDETMILASKTGQVLNSFEGEKSVIDLNKERLQSCEDNRTEFLATHSRKEIIARIKQLIGFEAPSNVHAEVIETLSLSGYSVTKLIINRAGGLGFPALLMKPNKIKGKRPATLFAHTRGKTADLSPGGKIEQALNQGHIVLSIDVSNTGELKDGQQATYDNSEFWVAKLALYEGKTLMTYRTEDLLMAVDFLQQQEQVDAQNIHLISTGLTGPAALHAGAIGQGFNSISLKGSIRDWTHIARSYRSKDQLGNIVPNVLNYYDLPDLATLMPDTEMEMIRIL